MSKALASRRMGQFPLSIATSIAFESMYNMDPAPDASEFVRRPRGGVAPIKRFKELWINLRTLLRNIDGAIDPEVNNDAAPIDYYKALVSEIQTIHHLIGEMADDERPMLNFYTKTYKSLSTKWPHALFRDVTAPKMIIYAKIENLTMEYLTRDIGDGILNSGVVHIADCNLNLKGTAALLSHFPVDLLMTRGGHFKWLVESHTGAIKEREEWNTKLRDGKKYPRVPFDRAMIQIFGDNTNTLAPQTLQIRRKLGELSEKYKWSPLTTKDRILFCVKQENEPVLYNLVKDCY